MTDPPPTDAAPPPPSEELVGRDGTSHRTSEDQGRKTLAKSQGGSSSSPQRITAAETRRNALQLRKAGASFREIAEQCGYANKGGAWNAISRELRALPRPAAHDLREAQDQARQLELERLDDLQFALWGAAMAGDTASVREVRGIMTIRAKLLGLDKFVEHDGVEEATSLLGSLFASIKEAAGPPPDEDDDDDDEPDDET